MSHQTETLQILTLHAPDTAKITHVDDVQGVSQFFRGFLKANGKVQANAH